MQYNAIRKSAENEHLHLKNNDPLISLRSLLGRS